MNETPRAGAVGTKTFVVREQDTIHFGDPVPPLLSTPALIWQLEHAAIEALKPFASPNEISLGNSVELQHLSPSALGASVACTARVVRAEGPHILFQIEAREGSRIIARGLHRRTIVDASNFARRLPKTT